MVSQVRFELTPFGFGDRREIRFASGSLGGAGRFERPFAA